VSEATAGIPHPDVIATERLHDGWLHLRADTLRFPSGNEGRAEVIEHPGGVTVVAIDPEGRLLLVRQYRHPVGRDLLELPAGTLDPGETPEVCAARELQEEAGYKPGRLEKLGGFYLAPGYCSEYQHVFLATELTESHLDGEEEAIELEALPLDDALGLVATGEIVDSKTVAALLLYQQRR
jgi:ADP-ribose pyrophosphatase